MTSNTFVRAGAEQIVHEVTTPLIARHHPSNTTFVSGTAFIIGHGFALTASHVIEDVLARFRDHRKGDALDSGAFDILMYLQIDEGTRFLPLKVFKIWHSNASDIAVLRFGVPSDWPEDHIWKLPRLQLCPPKAGEEIAGFGFPNVRVEPTGRATADLEVSGHTTTGRVVQIHHARRDSVRLRFPCYQVDARFDGGMSGGPIFNRSGHVCGVICSSMPVSEGLEHVSYACTLWPIVGDLVSAAGLSAGPDGGYELSQLFDLGVANCVDRSLFVALAEQDGRVTTRALYDMSGWQ